jgi:hypothetical protein
MNEKIYQMYADILNTNCESYQQFVHSYCKWEVQDLSGEIVRNYCVEWGGLCDSCKNIINELTKLKSLANDPPNLCKVVDILNEFSCKLDKLEERLNVLTLTRQK